MFRFFKAIIAMTFLVIAFLSSCKKESTTTNNPTNSDPFPVPSSYVKLGETYILGAKVKAVVYATSALTTGYNKLYVAMYDSIDGKHQMDGHFSIDPIMDMGTMQHGTPYEPMDEVEDISNGLYEAGIVFTMPSSTGNTWKLNIAYHNHRYDLEGEGELDLNVTQATVSRLYFLNNTPDTQNLTVALIDPLKPQTGMNTFELGIYKRIGKDYLPDSSYTISINPQMLSMGHSSPNNVNPTATHHGHYAGKVNFTMSGTWRVYVTINKKGTLIDDKSYFDITP